MSPLDDLRLQINEVDDEIAELVAARLVLVRRAQEAKRESGDEIYDRSRELAIYLRIERTRGSEVAQVIDAIVATCRNIALHAAGKAAVPRPIDGRDPKDPP